MILNRRKWKILLGVNVFFLLFNTFNLVANIARGSYWLAPLSLIGIGFGIWGAKMCLEMLRKEQI